MATCVGIVYEFTLWYNQKRNEMFIAKSDSVVAVCTEIFDDKGEMAVSFRYKGKIYEGIVVDDYGQYLFEGSRVTLYVNPYNSTQCEIEYKKDEGAIPLNTKFVFCIGGNGLVYAHIFVEQEIKLRKTEARCGRR